MKATIIVQGIAIFLLGLGMVGQSLWVGRLERQVQVLHSQVSELQAANTVLEFIRMVNRPSEDKP